MAEPLLAEVPLPPGFGKTRGSEHEVWFEADGQKVIKATHAGECGRIFGPCRFATEQEYLERIAILRTEFSLDWEVLGFNGEGKRRRIVTTQPVIPGKAATRDEIARFLQEMDFVLFKTRFGDAWYRGRDNLLVADAEPNNVLTTDDAVVPIDILVSRPTEELLRDAGII